MLKDFTLNVVYRFRATKIRMNPRHEEESGIVNLSSDLPLLSPINPDWYHFITYGIQTLKNNIEGLKRISSCQILNAELKN